MDHWAKLPLNFDPGTKWQYSNTNYVIAGLIVEKVSGQTLLSFLQEKIFNPLGMKSAGFCDDKSRRMPEPTRGMLWACAAY